jgi:hypothetical protein
MNTESNNGGSLKRLVRRTATRLWLLTEKLPNHAEQYRWAWLWCLSARIKTASLQWSVGCSLQQSWKTALMLYPRSPTSACFDFCRIRAPASAALPVQGRSLNANGGRPIALTQQVAQGLCSLNLSNLKRLLRLLKRNLCRFTLGRVSDEIGNATHRINGGPGKRQCGSESLNVHNGSSPNCDSTTDNR